MSNSGQTNMHRTNRDDYITFTLQTDEGVMYSDELTRSFTALFAVVGDVYPCSLFLSCLEPTEEFLDVLFTHHLENKMAEIQSQDFFQGLIELFLSRGE